LRGGEFEVVAKWLERLLLLLLRDVRLLLPRLLLLLLLPLRRRLLLLLVGLGHGGFEFYDARLSRCE
jgi:hypothetical protein